MERWSENENEWISHHTGIFRRTALGDWQWREWFSPRCATKWDIEQSGTCKCIQIWFRREYFLNHQYPQTCQPQIASRLPWISSNDNGHCRSGTHVSIFFPTLTPNIIWIYHLSLNLSLRSIQLPNEKEISLSCYWNLPGTLQDILSTNAELHIKTPFVGLQSVDLQVILGKENQREVLTSIAIFIEDFQYAITIKGMLYAVSEWHWKRLMDKLMPYTCTMKVQNDWWVISKSAFHLCLREP